MRQQNDIRSSKDCNKGTLATMDMRFCILRNLLLCKMALLLAERKLLARIQVAPCDGDVEVNRTTCAWLMRFGQDPIPSRL